MISSFSLFSFLVTLASISLRCISGEDLLLSSENEILQTALTMSNETIFSFRQNRRLQFDGMFDMNQAKGKV
jgi:hypothetical protein